MKLFLFIVLFFIAGFNKHQTPQSSYNLNTFTNIPSNLPNLSDCGTRVYYQSKQDVDKGKMICITDYDIVLIYINNKQISLKENGQGAYTSGKYSLTIKDGKQRTVGDENWTMKSSITIKYSGKLIWNKQVIGFGGC